MRDPQGARVWRVIILVMLAVFACTIISVGAFFLGQQVAGREISAQPPQIVLPQRDANSWTYKHPGRRDGPGTDPNDTCPSVPR
jgi:hypothetical protein